MSEGSCDNSVTVIGVGARFKGDLTLEGPAQILGVIEGQINSSGQVTVGSGASCQARVEAATIIVDGNVAGDLIARERLQLTNKAIVNGDISAAALVVADGATFIGHVAVGPEAVAAAQKKKAASLEIKPLIAPAPWRAPVSQDTDWASHTANVA
jgi:cytoskeletal protein CcmA (bactofilin family)